jgi:hypothetical protein
VGRAGSACGICAGGLAKGSEVSKQFFFEKKNQKTFTHWLLILGSGIAEMSRGHFFFLSADRLNIIVLVLFFKKELLPSL